MKLFFSFLLLNLSINLFARPIILIQIQKGANIKLIERAMEINKVPFRYIKKEFVSKCKRKEESVIQFCFYKEVDFKVINFNKDAMRSVLEVIENENI